MIWGLGALRVQVWVALRNAKKCIYIYIYGCVCVYKGDLHACKGLAHAGIMVDDKVILISSATCSMPDKSTSQ